MGEPVYVDLQILASVDDDDYLVRISKKDLNELVSFDETLVLRNWDGERPVILLAYGADAVRTEDDAIEGNNLSNLPSVDPSDLPG